MKIKINNIYIYLVIALLAGCTKEQPYSLSDDCEESVVLTLDSRSTVLADEFENGSTFRLSIFDAGTTNSYQSDDFGDMYNDIMAIKSSDVWGYSFDGGESTSPQFGYIVGEDGNYEYVDLLAAYPYIDNDDLSAVDFTSETQMCFMWAKTENTLLNATTITENLAFSHIMSVLNFKMKLLNNVNGVTLTSITLELFESEDEHKDDVIISEGTIDFNDGEMTNITYASSFTFSYDSTNSLFSSVTPEDGSESYYYLEKQIYLPPFDGMAATDYIKLSFMFDNVDITESITIKGDQLTQFNNGYGMALGYRYNISIELDNYLKFGGEITKDQTWSYAEESLTTDI